MSGQVKVRKWSNAEQELLVDILLEEDRKGNSSENGFKTAVWHLVVQRLHSEYPQPAHLKKEKQHVYSCWARLKDAWKVMDALKSQSGFGWDESNQSVTADEEVWDMYLQAHPEAKQFRTKGFALYSKLAPLVSGRVATGKNVVTPGRTTQGSRKDSEPAEDEADEADNGGDDDNDEAVGDDDDEVEVVEDARATRPSRKRAARQATGSTKRVRLSATNGLFAMAEAVKEMSSVMSSSDTGTDSSPNRHKHAIQLLEDETEFSDEEIVTAIDLFARNRALGDSYSAISRSSLRTRWLRKQLRAETEKGGMYSTIYNSTLSPVPSSFDYNDLSY
ncbi:hypothetical protein CALVIDRAFT_562302 [Calocera viscosa TUFC12733]|uniref:Myb/SANT-like domain-containing protein n=1 Tax=Calocera viscosa (strain TUFC12733) TaxID=1330018 RepID=A0A167P3Y6_CALVF|nr:hypothetical protein CALVIDRAFT_562302 [Calocera viscosa TUFC12733]